MPSLATEFPVKPGPDRAVFLEEVRIWLRGTKYSTVFDNLNAADLVGDTAHLQSSDREEFRFREFGSDAGLLAAIGFRHDFADEGRLWRTEAVLRRAASSDRQDLFRLRTECIALEPGVRLLTPRKPYLIKTLLRKGWGGTDGRLPVSSRPIWLKDDEASLDVARAVTLGEATANLPVVYISATDVATWLASEEQIGKLAFDVGGVAHVVVEPSRAFSFRLRDLTDGRNAYSGTLAIALPRRGIVRRFFLSWRFPRIDALLAAVRESAVTLRSQMPAAGWDWTELQEQALRRQRERDRSLLSSAETERLYEEEIANLQDRIKRLESELAARTAEEEREADDTVLPADIAEEIGPQIYPGEFQDRIRFAIRQYISRADQTGLDKRSKLVLGAIAQGLPFSPALSELLEDLKRATKDPKRSASELTALLCRHGYREKSDNRHIRLEADSGFCGLDTITLPKTPSDHRSLANLRKQIERTLGIAKLSE